MREHRARHVALRLRRREPRGPLLALDVGEDLAVVGAAVIVKPLVAVVLTTIWRPLLEMAFVEIAVVPDMVN